MAKIAVVKETNKKELDGYYYQTHFIVDVSQGFNWAYDDVEIYLHRSKDNIHTERVCSLTNTLTALGTFTDVIDNVTDDINDTLSAWYQEKEDDNRETPEEYYEIDYKKLVEALNPTL